VCHIWKQAINWDRPSKMSINGTGPSAPISFVVGSTSTMGKRRRSAASGITGAGVGLFLDAEFIDPRLPRRPVSDLRHGTIARYRFQRASPSLWETAADLHVLAGRLCGSLFLGTLPAAGPQREARVP
jgi:hypothetical protein